MEGLRQIVEATGPMHGLEAPPEREDFDDQPSYSAAYDEWWIKMHCWTAEVRRA